MSEIASRFRSERNVQTEETIVAEAIKNGDVNVAVSKLIKKPSVFARTLDKLLRDSSAEEYKFDIEGFESIVKKIESKVLIQLLGHFKGRKLNETSKRLVVTAGSKSKTLLAPPLPALDDNRTAEVKEVIRLALEAKFCERALLKSRKLFIQPEARQILLPLQLASTSEDKRTIARGSRVPLDLLPEDSEKSILRMFIHWLGQDVDLSALMLSEDFTRTEPVAYYQLETPFAWHSGDFTFAPPPDGASEFIDVDLDRALELGFRYVSMDVRVYSGPTFLHHEQCFAGFMLRKEATSGEIFEPASVWSKFDITHDGKSTVLCLFDIKTRQMIWIDSPIELRRLNSVANNLSNNLATVLDVLKSYLEMQSTKVTISELGWKCMLRRLRQRF